MKQTGALLCLVIGFTVVRTISISGSASLNKSGISAGGSFIFPRIPGFNVPLSSLFRSRTTTPSSTSNTSTTSPSTTSPSSNSTSTNNPSNNSTSSNGTDSANPSSNNTTSDNSSNNSTNSDSSNDNSTQKNVLPLTDVGSVISLIPGVGEALDEARQHVAEALSLGANFEAGISQAIDDAASSDDPTAALRTLNQTIVEAYATVAANCPLIVVGNRVLQEGIRLAGEVARSAQNVILGTNSTSLI